MVVDSLMLFWARRTYIIPELAGDFLLTALFKVIVKFILLCGWEDHVTERFLL